MAGCGICIARVIKQMTIKLSSLSLSLSLKGVQFWTPFFMLQAE